LWDFFEIECNGLAGHDVETKNIFKKQGICAMFVNFCQAG
jgi:hypothetical protein